MSTSGQEPGAPPPPINPYGSSPPYGAPPVAYGRPSPSSAMATWSLVLAIIICIPFATLISIGLAIATLTKPDGGRQHGRVKAIAALIIDGLVIVAVLALVTIGVATGTFDDTGRDDGGRVTESADISVFDLRVGDCFDDDSFAIDDDGPGEAERLQVIPCAEPHELEAFLTVDLEDGPWPGEEAVTDQSVDLCTEAFEEFVGRAYARSDLRNFYIYPQEDSWTRLDDRAVLCAVGERERRITGTLRDADR